MLSKRAVVKPLSRATLSAGAASARSLSVLVGPSPASSIRQQNGGQTTRWQQQQTRTLLGMVHAIDVRVYRWAKNMMPPISKTEKIALGSGTIGALFGSVRADGFRHILGALLGRSSPVFYS